MEAMGNTQGRGLRFVFFALCTGLELMGEQGAQEFEDHPQHGRANENKEEQKHQHNSGVNEKLNHYRNPFLKEVSNHLSACRA